MLRTGDLTSRHGELNEDFSQEKWWKRETDDSLLTLSSSIVSRQVWGIRSNNVDTVYKIMVKTSKVRGKPRWIFVRGLLRCLAALPEMRPSKRFDSCQMSRQHCVFCSAPSRDFKHFNLHGGVSCNPDMDLEAQSLPVIERTRSTGNVPGSVRCPPRKMREQPFHFPITTRSVALEWGRGSNMIERFLS